MAVKARLLTYDGSLVPDGGSAVLCSLAGPLKLDGKDAAGHSFHLFALKQAGLHKEAAPEEPDEASTVGSDAPERPATPGADEHYSSGWQNKGKKKKDKSKQVDLYALLGLANERWTATDAQIKLAYRKTALEHHPDKAGAGIVDEAKKRDIEERFQQINDAYETLSDAAKRREYDSIDDFDDTLPSSCGPLEFFKVFGPAFKRNSRWSVQQPVPDPGDDRTDIEVVERFYDFWFGFKSWREFPHPDEEDLEQAENREHKRFIERYNNKLRQAAKKDETRRMKAFVNNAYACDPRVLRRKAEEKAERDRKKSEKEAARQRKIDEEREAKETAARKEQEAVQAAAEQAAVDRKARQFEKKAMQRQRSKLRSQCAGLVRAKQVEDDDVEMICTKAVLKQIQVLTSALEEDGLLEEQQINLVQTHVEELQGEEETQRRAKARAAAAVAAAAAAEKRAAAKAKVARMRAWEEEEIRMLEKALEKYPQGTAKRWEQITGYVRTRDQDEVIEMAKHGLRAGAGIRHSDRISIAKKRQGNTTINSDPTGRLESFTDVDVKTAGEAIQELANGDGPPPPAASHTPATHAPTPGSMPVAADSGKPPAAASKPVAADSGKPPAASSQAGSAGSQQVKPTRTPAAPSTADVKPASKAAAEAGGAKRPAASEAKPSQAKASAAASKPVAADSGKPPAASSQAGSAGSQQVKPTRTPAAPSTADVKPASKAAAEAGGAKRPAASEAKPSQAKASAPPPPAQQAASATDQHPQPARQAAAEPPLWSEEQELALVQALKQVGKDVPDRWDRIADSVPGKSKAQCQRRFKELKETFRAKKATT